MGLAVDVGQLAYCLEHDEEGAESIRADLAAINAALAEAGLPGHVEPETRAPKALPHVSSFPYSFIHYLRRAFAHTREGAPPLTPAPPRYDPSTDDLMDEELTLHMDSHLCCHSDAEGYYVPVDFEEVLYVDDVPGVMVGSSQALLRELLQVAPILAIPVVGGSIDVATAEDLMNTPDSHPYFRERIVWGALFAKARVSVEHGAAISFT